MLQVGLEARKHVFGYLQTTKGQTSLHIVAVWSAPLLFAYWKVSHLDLLQGKGVSALRGYFGPL